MAPYDDIDLGQHCFRQRIGACWNQAITWTNVDVLSVRSSLINPGVFLQEMFRISILDMCLKIINIQSQPHLPGDNELKTKSQLTCCYFTVTVHGLSPAGTATTKAPSQYKDGLSRYGDSHYQDKTVIRRSYLYYDNPYCGQTVPLFWDDPQMLPPKYIRKWYFSHYLHRMLS